MLSQNQTQAVKNYLLNLQNQLCSALEQEETSVCFSQDHWEKSHFHGGGLTRVLEHGKVLEKAAVNFSHVTGEHLPTSATERHPELGNASFEAMGISCIIHPLNPYAPTTHANLRLFTALTEKGASLWWFGGGLDLTPYYGFVEDCQHFHQQAKAACDPFGPEVYARYKDWADRYFYLKHRKESRGIGGIFFDDLNAWGFDRCFEFFKSIGDAFLPAYQPILNRRKHIPYGEREKSFQLYRRGRYAEFNLIEDRGTQFGLKFGGRVESILASLPPLVSWCYHWDPEPGTPEAELMARFLKPTNWINIHDLA